MVDMDRNSTGSAVTLEAFAARVGCHFTTASRLKAGQRLPGRKLLGRIIRAYHLDPQDALDAYTSSREAFGQFLQDQIFNNTDDGEEEDGDVHHRRIAV